jgi:hypothetical protein
VNQTETPFVAQLKNQIRKFVATAKQDGTVGMSVENLCQCVRPPSHTVEGAPQGGNVQWQYRTLFRETLASMTFKGFEIIGGAR